jgi:hypothetical protein
MAIDLGDTGDMLFEVGLPGMDADINISSIVSYVNGAQTLEPGVAVGINALRHLGPPAAGNVVGIVMRHPVYIAGEDGQWRYRESDAVPVMEFGRVWVVCRDGCTGSGQEPVNANADGSLGVAGSFPLVGAFWDSRAEAGGIAAARLNRILLPAAAPPAETNGDDGDAEAAAARNKSTTDTTKGTEPGKPDPAST